MGQLCLTLLFALPFAAYAATSGQEATKARVLAAAKELASKDCTPPRPDGVRIAGCEYSASFYKGKWGVLVNIIFVAPNGTKGYMPGGSDLYMFEPNGKFIERIRGM